MLVCHPHPLYGGTMHNKVVFRAAKAALQLGLPALRFNFRGVGKSEGRFAEGAGEREDVIAALNYLGARFLPSPICLTGFSFGAWVGLEVGAGDPRVCALVGIGLPTADPQLSFDFIRAIEKPTLIVQGTHDQFAGREDFDKLFASQRGPIRLHWVEGADHFFTGKLEALQAAIRKFLEEVIEANSSNPK